MTPYDQVMRMAVCEMLYLTCYVIDRNKAQEMYIKQWQRTH